MNKLKIAVFLTVLAIFLAQGLFASQLIESEILFKRLSASRGSHSIFASIVVFQEDGKEKLMCCWSEETGLKNIYYCTKVNEPNAEWTTPARATATLVNSKTPNMVVDPTKPGIVHLVWAEGETRHSKDITHRIYQDKVWTGYTRLVPHPNNDSFPIATILCDGTLQCAWEWMAPNPVTKQYDNTFLRCGNTWTINPEQTLWDAEGRGSSTNRNHHATHIEIASRGFWTYAVWQEGTAGQRVIMFSERIQKEGEDDHWSWPIQVSPSDDRHSFWPKICVDNFDNLHVMWGELRGKYGYRTRTFGEWQPCMQINKGFASRNFFSIKADEQDMVHCVFRGDGIHIFYNAKSARDLGEWPGEQKLNEDGQDCTHANLTLDTHGYAHVNYCDRPLGDSSHDVKYCTFKRATDKRTDYPEADFNMSVDNTTIVEGTTVTFDASPSKSTGGVVSSYHWDFGNFFDDNNKSEAKIVDHTFESEGVYTVTLAILDKTRGLIGKKTVDINVISGPMPPVNVTCTQIMSRGFIYRDFVNMIGWANNPQNDTLGFTIQNYNIYKREAGTDGEWLLVYTTTGNEYSYYDTGFASSEAAGFYQYGVSITAAGMESTVQPATPQQ